MREMLQGTYSGKGGEGEQRKKEKIVFEPLVDFD